MSEFEGVKVLLVEDDQNFGDVLRSYLEMNDLEVELATDGEKGYNAFRNGEFDLCILDVMMPRKDGFTLAREIKEIDKNMPVIFLTAKSLPDDVLEGFEVGGDDYITKPFNSDVLLARIHAVLRRSNKITEEDDRTHFEFGDFVFDSDLRELTYKKDTDDEDLKKLSPKEAELLKLFAIHKNNILTRSEALTKIWGEDNYFTARSMDVFVTKLRKYLAPDEKISITNIHGNGFRMIVKEEE